MLLLFWLFNLSAQDLYPTERTVYVQQEDLHIKATVILEGTSINIDNDLEYFGYHKNEIVSLQGGYVGQLLDGPYEVTFANLKLKEKGEFREGLKTGEWKYWFESGKLKKIQQWVYGQLNGDFVEFNEAGQIKKEGRYRQNQLHGKISYFQNGELKEEKTYKNGELKEKKEKEKTPDSKEEIVAVKKKSEKKSRKKSTTKKVKPESEPKLADEKTATSPNRYQPPKQKSPIAESSNMTPITPNNESVSASQPRPSTRRSTRTPSRRRPVTKPGAPPKSTPNNAESNQNSTKKNPNEKNSKVTNSQENASPPIQPEAKKIPPKNNNQNTSTATIKTKDSAPVREKEVKPNKRTSAPPNSRLTADKSKRYYVFAGSYQQIDYAERKVRKLHELGFKKAIVYADSVGKYHRALVETFDSFAQADQFEKKLERDFHIDAYVKDYKPR